MVVLIFDTGTEQRKASNIISACEVCIPLQNYTLNEKFRQILDLLFFFNCDVACDTITLRPATDPMSLVKGHVNIAVVKSKSSNLSKFLVCSHRRDD